MVFDINVPHKSSTLTGFEFFAAIFKKSGQKIMIPTCGSSKKASKVSSLSLSCIVTTYGKTFRRDMCFT